MNFQSLKSYFFSSKYVRPVFSLLLLINLGIALLIMWTGNDSGWKMFAAGSVFFVSCGLCLLLYRITSKTNEVTDSPFKLSTVADKKNFERTAKNQGVSEDLAAKISALREMRVLLGAALGLADSFRMISSQVSEFVPFAACVLLQPSETGQKLFVTKAIGENAEEFERVAFENEGLAGAAWQSKAVVLSQNLDNEHDKLPDYCAAFNSAIMLPLLRNAEVFAILAFYAPETAAYDANSVYCLEKLAAPIGDFLLQSLTLEKNQVTALTDTLTQLPNERAFCLLLEQQIAECQRFRGTRSFALLSFDIDNFREINRQHGHLAGDSVLSSAAFLVKQQLRQMDVLARSHGDEFLILLPSVGEEAARFIAERIEEVIAGCSFDVSENESVRIKINIGTAIFVADGETRQQLLQAVNFNRRNKKNSVRDSLQLPSGGQVLAFPQRRANDN